MESTVQNKVMQTQNESNSGEGKISKSHLDQERYTISSGIALIINNIEFNVPSLQLPDRKGSDVDASLLHQRFQELGFSSELVIDASEKEIENTFTKIKEERDKLKKSDCLIVAVLTHGNEDHIYSTDKGIKIKNLINEFNAQNCPELHLKPKIFIFQVCRGPDVGRGVNTRVISEKQDDPNQADAAAKYDEYDELFGETISIPNESDFLTVYSTSPGYASFRSTQTGSTFVSSLSEELLTMKAGEDFYNVLTRVNKKVGYGYKPNIPNCKNATQMPCFVSQLTKDLVLKQT